MSHPQHRLCRFRPDNRQSDPSPLPPPPPIYFKTVSQDGRPRSKMAPGSFNFLFGTRGNTATFKAHGVETKSPRFPRCTPLSSSSSFLSVHLSLLPLPSSLFFSLVLPLDDRSLRDLCGNVIGKLGRMSSIRRLLVRFSPRNNASRVWLHKEFSGREFLMRCTAYRQTSSILLLPHLGDSFRSPYFIEGESGDECVLRMSY